MKEKDGGPAFPTGTGFDANDTNVPADLPGMSMRDWFAAHASDGDIDLYREYGHSASEEYAKCFKYTRVQARYRFADAMLAERERNK